MHQVLAGNELKYLLSTSASKGTLPFLKENFQFNLPIFALKVKSRQIGIVQSTLGRYDSHQYGVTYDFLVVFY